ncbi:MAG: hypothetical protein ACQEQS_10450, partial [Thermodesulfobacteriota bacterium]
MTKYKIFIIVCCLFISGCFSSKNNNGDYNMQYDKFIEKTSPSNNEILVPGSEEEQKAINDFKNFYEVFSYEIIKENIEKIYA